MFVRGPDSCQRAGWGRSTIGHISSADDREEGDTLSAVPVIEWHPGIACSNGAPLKSESFGEDPAHVDASGHGASIAECDCGSLELAGVIHLWEGDLAWVVWWTATPPSPRGPSGSRSWSGRSSRSQSVRKVRPELGWALSSKSRLNHRGGRHSTFPNLLDELALFCAPALYSTQCQTNAYA